ncbi:sulfatase family protein [Leptospira saintgironsiae]|uniref:Sulfatase n=1 Tax=Leptospira saintgironsiae TaxID=2023183 RepID=A0A2M9YBV4_9LEPT|nr:sulfatase-like hydrolase/transferase [Leptospira saintgironsiae]PJZ49027.1 sulfatase [Leptospira saintgironsiae]
MSEFWLKFKNLIRSEFKSGNPWIHSGVFVFVLTLLCLLTNTSLHVMGVDISEFISLFYGLIPLLLRDLGGVFASSYAFFLGAAILFLGPDFSAWKKGNKIEIYKIYLILFSVLFLLFCGSVSEYPQVYGEFFYYRHSWIVRLLYFITDHFSPFFFKSVLFLFLAVQVARAGFTFWEAKSYESLIRYVVFIILFYSFHLLGSAWGVLVASAFYSFDIQFTRSKKDLTFIAIMLLGFGFSFFTGSRLERQQSVVSKEALEHSSNTNVLIISADSIRQDQLGFVKGEKDKTPNIDQLASESLVFLDHHSTIPRTFPSWADFLSGKYSFEHGIQDMFPDKEDRSKLGNSVPTLPGILGKSHRTYVVSSFAGDIFPRASWGFQNVYAPNFSAETLTQQRTIESQVFFLPVLTGTFFGGGEYLSSIRSLPSLGDDFRILPDLFSLFDKKDRPFFALYFSSVTHFPYSPPYPFYKNTDPSYYGPSKYFRFVDPSNSEKPDKKEQEQIRSVYSASLTAFDFSVGKILEELKRRGLYDDTLIILTSDHGESLFEEDHSHGHGEHLRGEGVTKIPLIIKFPKSFERKEVRNFKGITTSLDVFPTILSVVGTPTDPKLSLRGKDLTKLPKGDTWAEDRFVYSETGIWFSDRGDHFFQKDRIHYPNILELHTIDPNDGNSVTVSDPYAKETVLFSKHRMLQTRTKKLIYVPSPGGVLYTCYDRISDPWNTKPLPASYCGDLQRKLELLLISSGKWKKAGDYFLPKTEP